MNKKSFMLGSNKSIIDSSIAPHSKIYKSHVASSFNRFRETIIAGIFSYYFIQVSLNQSDVLNKHWSRDNDWYTLEPLNIGEEEVQSFLRKNKLRYSS